jgi:oxepin-CoA hydrolase/3-oxo-5,6-dehydrosuberyl-CoA semialdehyde dehydrogenase
MEGVRMGALATQTQVERVRENVLKLAQSQEIVFGNPESVDVIGDNCEGGAFFSPILFVNNDPFHKTDVHEIEAFGPVSTIMPYKNMDDAIELARMGKGSLVSSIVTPDNQEATEYVVGAASMHGRILV